MSHRRRLQGPTKRSGEEGYVLLMVLLVLVIVGVMTAVLGSAIAVNQNHVVRDRSFTKSLAVAEAGLNRYLWMVETGESSEINGFAIAGLDTDGDPLREVVALVDPDENLKGTYAIEVTPPSAENVNVSVKVTGISDEDVEPSRTVAANIRRPSFSEYVLLVDDYVHIGGPIDRVWKGRTHSNKGVEIDTAEINDLITCSQRWYGSRDGVFSDVVPKNNVSRELWKYIGVPEIPFAKVTQDFVELNSLATVSGVTNLPYVTPSPSSAAHGWYIKIVGSRYYIAKVKGEREEWNYSSGLKRGGYLTYDTPMKGPYDFPVNGVIFVNDSVWVEGKDIDGRLTIAASGQFNNNGKTASISIVGDLTYAEYDGTVAMGLIAQYDVKIPMYAPMEKAGTMGTRYDTNVGNVDMRVDAAIIAQKGKEYVNHEGSYGPRRGHLTLFGSVSTLLTPYRVTVSSNNRDYGGFGRGTNEYDPFMLYSPPPHFPTVGSYQIGEWRELPSSQAVDLMP
jgi:type II secretory pathway pseudopilin PulG